MEAHTENITLGTAHGGLYLGFGGRATLRVCPTAETLIADYLTTAKQPPVVTLDLNGCTWVDSTFAGWMLALRRRIGGAPTGRLIVTGCSDRCRATLAKMRVAELFEYADASPPAETREIACASGERLDSATLDLIARAHEELAATDEQNRAVFGPIAAMLRRQVATAHT